MNEIEFNKMFLGEKIKDLDKYYDDKIIQSIYFIKDISDKGLYYNKKDKLNEKKLKKLLTFH